MARGIIRYTSLPPSAQPIANRLARLGFPEGRWTYFENALLSEGMNIQVRDQDTQAAPADVNAYATAMLNEEDLPPVVFTKDGYLVDGVTRTAAARKIKWTHFHAFQLDVAWEGAPSALRDQLIYMGAALNLSHGRNLTKQNKVRIVLQVMKADDKPRDVARKLGGGVSENMISRIMNEKKARDRAERLGVDLSNAPHVTASHLALLGARLSRYNDEPFTQFLTLIRDASLSLSETTNLAKQIEDAPTEREKLEIIASETGGRQTVIHGPSKRPPRSAKLRQHLGYGLNFRDTPDDLVELSPEAADNHLQVIYDSIALLRKVANAQQNLESSRMAPTE